MLSVSERQFGELNGNFPGGRKIGVHGCKCAAARGNAFNLRNLAGSLSSDGQNQFIECIDRLNKMPVNRLPHFLHANFAIEHNLQSSSPWNPQINVFLNYGYGSFRTLRRSM